MARKKSVGSKNQKVAGDGGKRGAARRPSSRAKRSLISRLKFW